MRAHRSFAPLTLKRPGICRPPLRTRLNRDFTAFYTQETRAFRTRGMKDLHDFVLIRLLVFQFCRIYPAAPSSENDERARPLSGSGIP